MIRGRYLWSIRVPLLLVVLGMLCGISRGAAEKVYDGHWWLSASKDEQKGFLNGYSDCYTFDFNGPSNDWVDFPDGAQGAITAFYKSHPIEESLPTPDIFSRLPLPPAPNPSPTAELWTNRHVYYDGQYWGVLGDDGQLGYVEGYLWCWKNCLHSKGATFSKSPKEYVALINKWYGINPKTGINADRESAKIADVLYKFRDRQQSPQGLKK